MVVFLFSPAAQDITGTPYCQSMEAGPSHERKTIDTSGRPPMAETWRKPQW